MTHIGLIGEPNGFSNIGGIHTLKNLLEVELHHRGYTTSIIKAGSPVPKESNVLIVLGCSSPWAYRTAIRARLRGQSVLWIPCFHPASHVRHKGKARIAARALRLSQKIGITICALSEAEKLHLDAGRCVVTSLPFSIEYGQAWPTEVESSLQWAQLPKRPFAVVYLGRPVAQKGWPQFLDLIVTTNLPALALVPTEPEGPVPGNLTLRVGVDNNEIQQELRQASVLFLPADYESFGFAQAEALLAGCCVPVLGEWPLWLDVAQLDWRQLTAEQHAHALKELITNSRTMRKLREQQIEAWRHRPERMAPMLPLITCGTVLY